MTIYGNAKCSKSICFVVNPFGVVIWQDVSNMSLQGRLCPLYVANVMQNNLYYRKNRFLLKIILDKICLYYARINGFMQLFR